MKSTEEAVPTELTEDSNQNSSQDEGGNSQQSVMKGATDGIGRCDQVQCLLAEHAGHDSGGTDLQNSQGSSMAGPATTKPGPVWVGPAASTAHNSEKSQMNSSQGSPVQAHFEARDQQTRNKFGQSTNTIGSEINTPSEDDLMGDTVLTAVARHYNSELGASSASTSEYASMPQSNRSPRRDGGGIELAPILAPPSSTASTQAMTRVSNSSEKHGREGTSETQDELPPGAYNAMGRAIGAPRRGTLVLPSRKSSKLQWRSSQVVNANLVDEMDLESEFREKIMRETVEAEQVDVVEVYTTDSSPQPREKYKLPLIVFAVLLISIAIIVLALSGRPSTKLEDTIVATNVSSPTLAPSKAIQTPTETPTFPPTLEAIKQRGHINCRVSLIEREVGYGFSIDMCRALSAAIFDGDSTLTEFSEASFADHWAELRDGLIDVSTDYVTHTMTRSIHEPNSGSSFLFSTPYLYSGTLFAGSPGHVECAESGQTLLGICKELKVCVRRGTTTELIVKDHLDITSVETIDDSLQSGLVSGLCNVIASDPTNLSEDVAREAGYMAEYVFGSKFLSREPLALVTRSGDVEFADFCNWVVQSFLVAESKNISQSTANMLPEIDVFGNEYSGMFANAISAVGNYGELYERTIGDLYPRQGLNKLADGSNGLMISHPFGDLTVDDNVLDTLKPTQNGTMRIIEKRNKLRCGVIMDRPTFAFFNESSSDYYGIDVDYCAAITAAMFSGDVETNLEIVPLLAIDEIFISLSSGSIDVAAGIPYTMKNDVDERYTGNGFTFSPCYYYELNAEDEKCLGLVTREDDDQWSNFVRWIVWALIFAEESNVSSGDALDMPFVYLFGPHYERMFQYAILAMGNSNEIFQRNLDIVRDGPNLLNRGENPMLFPWVSSFV